MNCQICGKPASIHLTDISLSDEKSEGHYCIDHAREAGLSPQQAQSMRDRQAAMTGFIAYVKANRRVLTEDEMQQIGVLRPGDPGVTKSLEYWKQIAQLILADDEE